MDFGFNGLQYNNHHQRELDLMMMESASSSASGFEEEGGGLVVRGELVDSEKDRDRHHDHHQDAMSNEREHMFDKVVTPSDVGKLNRLVIPKQHAERYFPLDSSNNEKGLLLNFEDRNGKSWRFRYSYWNSSQSYVMTKGWSRFVKEKRLDAGDIVSFQRGLGDLGRDRLYIDWRRRPEMPGGGGGGGGPNMEHYRHTLGIVHHHQQQPPYGHFSCRPTSATAVVPGWSNNSSLIWRPLGSGSGTAAPPIPRDHFTQLNNNNLFDWNNSYGRTGAVRNRSGGGCSYGYGSVVKTDHHHHHHHQLGESSVSSALFYLRTSPSSGSEMAASGRGRAELMTGEQVVENETTMQHDVVEETAIISTSCGSEEQDHGHLQLQQGGGGGCGGGDGASSLPAVVDGDGNNNNLPTPKRSRLRLFGVNMDCPISSNSTQEQNSTHQSHLFLSSSNPKQHQN